MRIRTSCGNGPINTIDEVFKEPQVIARGMNSELPHAAAGKVPLVASPMKFSESPIKHEIPPPVVGQHTDEILRGVLQKNDAEIAQLRGGGIALRNCQGRDQNRRGPR